MLGQFQEWVDFYDLILHNTCQYAIAIKFATRFKKQVFATLPGVPLSPGLEVVQVLSAPKSPSYRS